MAIAGTVRDFLEKSGVKYALVAHSHSESSQQTAQAAHVPPNQLAKAVVLIDRVGYLMAVLPGDRHVGVETLSKKLGRKLELATESRLAPVFKDCDPGAIPPLGPAYGMETVLDDGLVGLPHIYFEAGNHEELVRIDGEQFVRLMNQAQHGQFSH